MRSERDTLRTSDRRPNHRQRCAIIVAPVRILMIAPEPFFEPRGTPFSELHRIRALTDLGHEVDLVTYPFGQDVPMSGLRVFRAIRPPFIHGVKVGPSLAKVPLDLMLAFTAIRRALTGRYDAIHSHEEGALIGVLLAAFLRKPHLYDMHSSLPQQLANFGFSRSPLVRAIFARIERLMIRRSRVVIVVCPSLETIVRQVDADVPAVLIENAPGSIDGDVTPDQATAIRAAHGIPGSAPLVVYTGTLEQYQGLDLLFSAMALVIRERPDARLLLAGGTPDQVNRARQDARKAAIDAVTIFAGQRPAPDMPAYLAAADVLVSPRSRGTNTPLKIYQYLRSGKPIVATRLLTHTQVLSDDTAILTGTSASELAAGLLQAITDPATAARVGRQAEALARTKYSYEAYLDRTRHACAVLVAGGTAVTPIQDVV